MLFEKKLKSKLSDVEKTGKPDLIALEHLRCKGQFRSEIIKRPRASSLYEACMRQHVLCTLSKTPRRRKITFSEKLTFSIGNAIHYHFQNTPDLFGDNRWGRWKCRGCGYVTSFRSVPERSCPKCGAINTSFDYHEIRLKAPKPYIGTGHPDMYERVSKMLRTSELKSMNGEEFESLQNPLIEHEWQIQSYMWWGSENFDIPIPIDPEVGYIIYIAKKAFRKILPIKVFVVERDERIIDQIKKKLKQYVLGIAKKRLPPPVDECPRSSWNGYRFRSCPVKTPCFKLANDIKE